MSRCSGKETDWIGAGSQTEGAKRYSAWRLLKKIKEQNPRVDVGNGELGGRRGRDMVGESVRVASRNQVR